MTTPAAETLAALREAAARRHDDVVRFCAELVQAPSFSGDEEQAAQCARKEMERLGFDDVEIDGAGNVVGTIRGNGDRAAGDPVLLNAHLDVVGVGDPADWPRPPFEGEVHDGRLWGRGSTDTKSSVAGQVHAAAAVAELAREGVVTLERDLVVAAVVQEEVGGLGTASLLDDGRRFVAAVIGEPSLGGLAYGHKGRVELDVRFEGRAAHASRPEWGLNPHPSLARFVLGLDDVERDEDERFGRSSAVPTLVQARPDSPNVIPQQVRLTVDWRNVPGEPAEAIRKRVQDWAAASAAEDGVTARVGTPTMDMTSWKGRQRDIERVSLPFVTDPESAIFRSGHAALESALEREVPVMTWDFASDGGWLAAAGVTCLGFGPGDMQVMHAVNESVSVELLRESVAGYAALALALDTATSHTATQETRP